MSGSLTKAIRVYQWLPEWNDVHFDESLRRRRPPDHFLLFSLSVGTLRRLTGIERRSTAGAQRRSEDDAIQRRHSPERSEEIRRFVKHGYPWSTLSRTRRESGKYDDLKMPGWLPTAVVVNIIPEGDVRRGRRVEPDDLVHVEEAGELVNVTFPDSALTADWEPSERAPLEIIDGQHRLWAFRPGEDVDFEVPVVAFPGLDISWQAYVFWTVNIKPKRISTSLAFDLYPLLRTADWLERAEGLSVYREARAQELTELIWAMEESPWYQRINMLGEGRWGVSQAAWIRSLLATFIKAYRGSGVRGKVGGLFGEEVGQDSTVLPWTRPQQAAFLIQAWKLFAQALADSTADWAESIREGTKESDLELGQNPGPLDATLASKYSLLSTDQGVRGFLYVLNDLFFVEADALELSSWIGADTDGEEDDESQVRSALKSLAEEPASDFMSGIAASLASFDWRSSSFPQLSDQQRLEKSAYRGSGGYRLLRESLLNHLTQAQDERVAEAARVVQEAVSSEEA